MKKYDEFIETNPKKLGVEDFHVCPITDRSDLVILFPRVHSEWTGGGVGCR